MSEAEPTLAELMQLAVQSGTQDIHVSMPGTVLSYDAATQTAKVQPGIRRVIFDDDDQQVHETIPPFENVPVMHYRCAAFSIHANLAPGDGVDLVFGSESMAEWRQGSEPVATPGDLKRLGLSSPKAYPGLFPKTSPGPDADNSIGVPGGLRIHFGTSAVNVGSGADKVGLDQKILAELNNIKSILSGLVAPLGGNPAIETAAAAAGTALGTALGFWTPASVGSSNLKAD